MAAPNVTYLVDPTGATVEVPSDQAAYAARLGYAPASEEQAAAFRQADVEAKTYGTTGQAVLAGVEGAARMGTLGGSTYLEKALGVDPEAIAARERQNPTAKLIGEGIGIAAPLLLTGGASAGAAGAAGAARAGAAAEAGLLSRAASLTAPALAARAGAGVTAAARAALPEATSLAGQIARQAAAAGAGSAVEGAFYGLGNVVHESALGDPKLTGEAIAGEILTSALLGGAVGAGVAGLGAAVTRLAGRAGEHGGVTERLREWLGDVEAERNIKAAGGIQSDITRARKQIGRERLNELAREAADLNLVGPFSTPESTLERAQGVMREAGAEIGDILRRADDVATAEVRPQIDQVINRVADEALRPIAQNPLQQDAANRLATALEGYRTRYQEGLGLVDLHAMRREISDALYGLRGNQDPFASTYREALHEFRTIVSDEIQQGLARIDDSVPPAWRATNRRYEVAARMAEFAEKGIDRGVGNNLVSLTEWMGGLGGLASGGPLGGLALGVGTAVARRQGAQLLGWAAGGLRRAMEAAPAVPAIGATLSDTAVGGGMAGLADAAAAIPAASASRARVAALSAMERTVRDTERRIDAGVAGIVRASAPAARSTAIATAASLKEFQRQVARIDQLASSPDAMAAALERESQDLHDHAPDSMTAAGIASTRAVAFLASKAPKRPRPGPLAPEWEPSASELATFHRYYEAVQNPLSVLKQAQEGTLTPESVEAVATVYPQLMDRIRFAALDKLSDRTKPVPYRQRLMLSLLLGQDMDGSLTASAALAGAAAAGATAPSALPSTPRPRPAAGKVTLPQRLLTQQQRASAR